MKRIFIYGLSCSLLIAAGCKNANTDSVRQAEKENNANTDSLQKKQSATDSSTAIPSKQDADFMVKAFSGGMMEVELGKLAQSNGVRPGVKGFGAMMVQDHGKGGDSIRALAMAKRIVLPDSVSNDQKKERDNLMKKHGMEFDRAYISLMVKDHKEDIAEFQHAAQNCNDPDIKALARNNLAMLQMHLDSAQSLDKVVGKSLKASTTAPAY